jgi:acyl carrier protein
VRAEVEAFLRREVIGATRAKPVAGSFRLLGGDRIDSVAMLQLLVHLEERLGIVIPEKDVTPENFADVGSVERYLAERLGLLVNPAEERGDAS